MGRRNTIRQLQVCFSAVQLLIPVVVSRGFPVTMLRSVFLRWGKGQWELKCKMEQQMTQKSEGELLPDAGEIAPTTTGQSPGDRHAARMSRVLDYQADSLEKENALEANLGSINSGLMQIALQLDETIKRTIDSGPGTVEGLHAVMPAIDTHLRVTRQVDRFAQIELRAAELRKSPGPRDETTASLVASAAPGISHSEVSAT